MKTKNTSHYGVAALSVQIANGSQNAGALQLTPDGTFKARDGRPAGLAGFVMSEDIAGKLITRLRARVNDIVVDYEHQTLYSEENGKPAPAAGWIDPQSVEFVPGVGLKAHVKWTETAAAHINKDEYRFISPVLAYDEKTGAVLDILHVGLTNFAAVDGMAKVAIEALRSRIQAEDSTDTLSNALPNNTDPKGDSLVDKSELIKLLGLSADATDEQITAALKAAQTANATIAALRADLELKDGDDTVVAVTALKGKAGAAPDPAKYAPVDVVEALKGEIAQLRAGSATAEVDALVSQALTDGKLLPAQEEWAKGLGNSNVAALKSYLDKTPAIAALKTTQTNGQKPAGADLPNKPESAPEAIAVLKQLGVSADDAAKATEQETN